MAVRRKDRSDRDAAGVGPGFEPRHRLVPLDELKGYDVARDEPDIRGWDVRTVSGREIGEVEELLVDPDRGEVVMLDIELRDGLHTEVPIRSVQLDRDRKIVVVDSQDIDAGRRADTARDRRTDDAEEVVVDRQPIIEETVIRRRVVEE